jgi:predicted aconitase with swiveling domain
LPRRALVKVKGKTIVPGIVTGEAIISETPISFTGGMDPYTGIIREPGHELQGKSVAGKILVFPSGKGSTTGSWQFYVAYKNGKAPIGMINVKAEGVVAISAVITDTPMIHLLESNPFEFIKTGDTVTINGDEGFVEVIVG